MDEQTNRPVPKHITDALEASVRDLAHGNVHDAEAVQAEARRILADHKRIRPIKPVQQMPKPTRMA